MKTVVPPIVFSPEPSDNAEEVWKRMYSRIFDVALQRLLKELADQEGGDTYPQLHEQVH